LAETTAAGVFIYKGNRFLYVNPVMTLKSGYTEEELLSMDVMDIVHPDFRGLLEERDLAREGGQEVPPRFELKITTKSGEDRWLDLTTGPIEFEGQLVGVGTAYDITERKRAEEALRKAEEKYRGIFENAIEGIFQTTPAGRYITANPALAHMFGYSSPEELVAGVTDIERQFYVDPNRRAEFKKRMEEGGEVIGFESQIYRKDGSVIWISENARAVRDERGKVLYYEGFIGDITARKRAEEQIQRQVQRLGALRSIDAAISGSLDLRVTFDVLLDQVTSRLGVDAADVLLMNPHAQMLEYAAGRGFRSPALQHTRLRLGEGYAGRALLERRIIAIADLRSQTHDLESGQSSIPNLKSSISNLRSAIQNEEFIAYYAAPLIAKGQIKGVLEIFHRSSLSPDPEWLNFLEALSAQAAIAVDNAELFNNLQRSNVELTLAYDTTLEGWSRALDLRDKETEGHTQRVTEMTMRLARVVGIGEAELVHVRRGALLHDIGKMGIPDGILLKPGPLTQEEQVIMCKHPVYAYEMLSPISYLKPALDIPYCHHEKWDGTGYPRMLRGEAIPLAARLFAVVDVWDALRSDRPYRSGWPGDKVKEHIQSLSGTHFDPKVAEAFLKMKELGSPG
jgi:PAS domain S-box-containing protein/putative nucleotidyltransferase with HDIG domain